MRLGLRFISLGCLLAAAVLTGIAVSWYSRGGRLYSVQTGSMQPLLRPGDVVLTKDTSYQRLRVGQVVTFRDAVQPSLITTHRVIAINRQAGRLTTKGDHNPQADLPIAGSQVIGQATMVAPRLGYLFGWLRRPWGLTVAVYLPAMLIVGHELGRWRDRTRSTHYQLRTR